MDLGVKSTSTTGSIAQGSNQLTVASATGFAVNDYLIIELGGEAGLGLRGTRGVGGAWPAKSYADATAMAADTGQAEGAWAWLESTGIVWRWQAGAWTAQTQDGTAYYTAKAVPKALSAKITGKVGNVLTLDATATVAATTANVYFDNRRIFNDLMGVDPPTAGSDRIIVWPPGDFAISDRLVALSLTRPTVMGAGKARTRIWSPKGTPGAEFLVAQCTAPVVRGLHLYGNARNDGFFFGSINLSETGTVQNIYPRGIWFQQCAGGEMRDAKATDAFQSAFGSNFSTNVNSYRCDVVLTEGLQTYIQWQFEWADSIGGDIVDPTVTSPVLTQGFESFRSRGVSFTRPVGVNAAMSVNSSGDWSIDSPDLSFTDGCQLSDASFSAQNAAIAITTIIQPPDPSTPNGGRVVSPRIVQAGYINAAKDSLRGIIIDAANPNVTVMGGLYQAPDYSSPSVLSGANAVNAGGVNTLIDGLHVVGAAANNLESRKNIYVAHGTVQNCIADTISAPIQINNHPNP